MKTKKLQLITVLLFILTILILIIGLILIDFFHIKEIITSKRYYNEELTIKYNGFSLLRYYNLTFLLNHYKLLNNTSAIISWKYENKSLLQLQIGIILLIIITPILTLITISLLFLNIGLKIKIKNNNFWDAIANCEIINNYYIH